jgi:hypothetical protein
MADIGRLRIGWNLRPYFGDLTGRKRIIRQLPCVQVDGGKRLAVTAPMTFFCQVEAIVANRSPPWNPPISSAYTLN